MFSEGMPAESFYLLLDGYIRVIRTSPEGLQVIALHIPPGQLFGIAPALGRDTYPATAQAAAESLTLSWPARLWRTFAARYEGFATETYRTVGERLGEFQARVTELATQASSAASRRRSCGWPTSRDADRRASRSPSRSRAPT